MNGRHALGPALVALVLACGGDAGDAGAGADSVPPLAEDAVRVQPDSFPLPDVPPPGSRGTLVTVSAGTDSLAGTFPMRAGRCSALGAIELLAETGEVGAIALVFLPDSGPDARAYPIEVLDTALAGPRARVGVQSFKNRRPAVYEAWGGTLWLDELNGTVSGRWQVQLREATTKAPVALAARFHRIPVRELADSLCTPLAPDSTGS